MAQGSSELNALLKARVVKIMVELDYKNSNLPSQVNKISTWLKEQGKQVKIGVKLDLTIKDFNSQMSEVLKKIDTSKTAQHPIKLQVQIDVNGSAKQIQKQLEEVYKTVGEFNKKYGKQVLQMQQMLNPTGGNGKQSNPFQQNQANVTSYVKSLKEAEKYMRSAYGSGVFGTRELKDANGQINGFIGTLTKANGVIQKIKYEWNQDKATFMPISRETVTETQKNVQKSLEALKSLQAQIEKLKGGTAKNNLQSLYDGLKANANDKFNPLNQSMVDDLKRQIEEEKVIQQNIRTENTLYQEQQKLLQRISAEQAKMANKTSARGINNQLGSLTSQLSGLNLDDNMSKNMINEIKGQFGVLKAQYQEQVKYENDLRSAEEKRLDVLQQLDRMTRTLRMDSQGNGFTSSAFVNETRVLAQDIKSMNDYIEVKRRMNLINRESQTLTMDTNAQNKMKELELAMKNFATQTGLSQREIEDRFLQVGSYVKDNITLIQDEINRYKQLVRIKQQEQELDARRNSLVGSGTKMQGMIDARDTQAIKQYVAELYGADVAMLKLSTDSRGLTRIQAVMESTGKTAREVTLELNNMDRELRQVGDRDVFNANRNLGGLEQLGVAMSRVPVWMVAMTAFYGTINMVKEMTSQIIELDTSMTELARVASSNLSLDTLFGDAVSLSKELGASTVGVLNSVGEMARTFGDFNERQLIAITRTATLMSNVSDLSVEEASQNLVGTMNAFNISAEESIHIVDALNEVDNNYAISTKQLSEGLSKSASTASTFGVTMEQVVGHITAIGAVTMESGAIIGNSLKSIYSRLTTVKDARASLQSVGVALTDMAGDSRSAESILADLGKRWNDLNHQQQQSIAVNVAGRYQLSRFIALMNNWQMALDATNTAVNSQGSAMRENDKYMKSFQARINILKDTFTEFATQMGKEILSDGLMNMITLLGKLGDGAIWVSKNIGMLPTLLIPISLLLGKMGLLEKAVVSFAKVSMLSGTVGIWKTLTSTVSRFMDVQRETYSAMRNGVATAGATATRTQALASAWRSVTVSEAGATIGMRGFAMAMKSALITTGVGALIVGLGYAIEKISGYIADQKRKAEELKKMNDKMVDSYRKTGDGMQSMVQRYDELSKKQILNKDEQAELNQLTKDFANKLPTTVAYVDANGKAHMKSADAIAQEVNNVKKLSEAQAKLKVEQFNENLDKQVASYDKINNKLKDLYDAQDKLIQQDGKKQMVVDTKAMQNSGSDQVIYKEATVDNSKAIQQNKVEIMMAEAEKTEALKKTIIAIQQQSEAWLEASGKMSNLSDAQESAVEKMIGQNETILRNAKNQKDAMEALYQMGNQVGDTFSTAMETYKQQLKDSNVDQETSNNLIGQFKKNMDSVAQTIPDYFYQLTDGNGNIVKSQGDVVNGLQEIINVSNEVGNATPADTNKLIYSLERAGLTADDAQAYLYRFAQQNDNAKIRAQLASQGIDGETASLQDLNQEQAKAIDLSQELFGYNNDDLDAMKTRISAMQIMISQGGDQVKNTQKYKDLAQEVADQLGITTDELEQHKEKYFALADAIEKIDWSKYTPNMDFGKFIDDQLKGDFPKQTRDLLKKALTQDVFTGVNTDLKQQLDDNVKKPVEDTIKEIKDLFPNVDLKLPEVDMTRVKASIFYVDDDIGKLQKKMQDFGITLNKKTGNAMIDDMLGSLQTTNGKIDNTKTNMLLLRGIINEAIGNENMFTYTGAGADTAKQKVDGTNQAISIMKQNAQTPFNPAFGGLNQGLDTAGQKIDSAKEKWNIMGSVFNQPMQVNQTPFQTVDGMLGTTKTNADNTKQSITDTVSQGSQLGGVNSDLKIVLQQSDDLKSHISKIDKSLDGFGNKFSTGSIRSQLNKLDASMADTKGKVSGLVSALNKIGTVKVGNVSGLVHQLALLSLNLVTATNYGKATAQAQNAIISAFGKVASSARSYNTALSDAGKNASVWFGAMAKAIENAIARIIVAYASNKKALASMVDSNNKSLNTMLVDYDGKTKLAVQKVDSMTSQMHKKFKDGIKGIVTSAGQLPRDIGNAIRKNMEDSSGAMQALAKDMVRRFKSELGIHSPSRVFTELGGWVVKGLVNGLSGHDMKTLGKDVFKDFGGGIFDSMDMIKAYLGGGMNDIGGAGSKAVQGWIMSAIGATGVSPSWLPALTQMAMKESGGNPRAINLWDSNAKAGHPSKGLMQTIDGTFNAYKMSGHNNIYNPVDNAIASIRYILARYGSIYNTPGMRSMAKGGGYRGYANGGIIDKMELAWHGEEGAEAIIPLIGKRRKRGLELWQETGEKLGIAPQAIAWLKTFLGKQGGGTASSSGGSFGASSGESGGGESGGGDSGASGTIIPSTPTITGTYGLDGNYQFTALYDNFSDWEYTSTPTSTASNSGTKSQTSKSRTVKTKSGEETIADAFQFDAWERKVKSLDSYIKILQTRLDQLTKGSVKYRDALKDIVTQQNAKLSAERSDLATMQARQKAINSELAKLPALSKQTSAQRDTYNSLMQEYDQNIDKIQSLQQTIESETADIKAKSLEIFTDFIDEIVTNYDNAINAIKAKVDETDFKIQVDTLVNPDDKKTLLNDQVTKATQLQGEEATAYNKQQDLQGRYNSAVKSYGSGSDQAKKLKDELDKATKDFEDAKLAVLQAEKDIKDTRASIADDSISKLKDYYGKEKAMAEQAIDAEKKSLQDAHDAKMKMYDDEENAINAIYSAKEKELDQANASEDYADTLNEKLKQQSDLQNKIALLSRDTSLEGRKKLKDAQDQLDTVNKDIADTQKQHQRDGEKQALEDQKQTQLNAINGYTDNQGVYHKGSKDNENDSFQAQSDALDQAKAKADDFYDGIINNEQKWAEMRNDAIAGNFTAINTELANMATNLSNELKGVFTGLNTGGATLSDATKTQLKDDNSQDLSNTQYNSQQTITDAKGMASTTKYTMTDGKIQTGTATKVTDPVQNTPPPPPPKPAPTPAKPKAPHEGEKGYKKSPTTGEWVKDDDSFRSNDLLDPNRHKSGYVQAEDGSWVKASFYSHGWKTKSALNLRSSASYSGRVLAVMPKGAKVEYLGMERGWAKVKYNGKTGYAGKGYLQQFKTGGYTGDWAGDDGKLAVLHKKEIVLNEKQTSNILDSAKIMDKISKYLPEVTKGNIADKLATASSVTTNITYGDINVTVQGGDKKKATDIAKELMNEIKKKGK